MTKILLLTLLTLNALFAVEIPVEKSKVRHFGKSVELNAKVIQLSNSKQSIMSLVSGHIEKYYVVPGSQVKAGQKIALVESIMLSKMTANYISLKKQFSALEKNFKATNELYQKGMASMKDLNSQSIQRDKMLAQIYTLESQLKTLGIDTKTLKNASADYVLYAHTSGVVSALLQPLHSVISEDTPIIDIVKNQAFYIESYLPLEYAQNVKLGQKLVVNYGNQKISAKVTQILPEIDSVTQRVVVLSRVTQNVKHLFINTYVKATLYFDTTKKYVAVKNSALSFFNGEWVVFVPKEEDEHHEGEEEHEDEEDHEGEHDEHEEHEAPYEIVVVKIITQDDEYSAVEGVESGVEYVSDKSYYVKSMLLKSSLGEHGH